MGSEAPLSIAIVGGGIAGTSLALALTTYLPRAPRITVFELRSEPSTIGGAINLTPNALRYLDQLSALSIITRRKYGASVDAIDILSLARGSRTAQLDFANGGSGFGVPPYKALRILRSELLGALLEAIAKCNNVRVEYGKKTTKVEGQYLDRPKVLFDDGSFFDADLVLGCDGIHSVVRTTLVDPSRQPAYSGVAVSYGFTPHIGKGITPPGKDTAVVTSRHGSLMTSFYEHGRTKVYVAGVIEHADVESKEGWRAKGKEQDVIRNDMLRRFGQNKAIRLEPLLEAVQEWTFYPIYRLPPKGKWAAGDRVMLLGDAAHAMPPQGESIGHCLEDVTVFARLLAKLDSNYTLADVFKAYESLRRARIDAAFAEANWRWESVKDSGWLAQQVKDLVTPWYIWFSSKSRNASFEEDLGTKDLNV